MSNISGWYDDEQVGTPLNFTGMTNHAPSIRSRDGQRLLMGPWPHGINKSTRIGEVDFGPQAVIDLKKSQSDWFDYWLKGIDNEVPDQKPVEIFVMGINKWRKEASWPLPDTQRTKFYITSHGRANSRFGDGVLTQELPDSGTAYDSYCYDPNHPVPFITDNTSHQIGGPDDYQAIERRDDVLVYTSPELTANLEVTGSVSMELYAS